MKIKTWAPQGAPRDETAPQRKLTPGLQKKAHQSFAVNIWWDKSQRDPTGLETIHQMGAIPHASPPKPPNHR